MSPKTVTTGTLKQITHLVAALKAPRITESAARLADHARDAGWTHEDYLAAVLEREVAARNASGARLRIRAAGMPALKTVEDFDFDHQPPARTPIQALASGAYLSDHRNVVLLGPPAPARPPGHRAGCRGLPARAPGPVRHRHRLGHPAERGPRPRPLGRRTDPAAPLRADHRPLGRLPALRTGRRQHLLPARLLPPRARLPDPEQQPAVQFLGRRLRRPSRRRSDDRPTEDASEPSGSRSSRSCGILTPAVQTAQSGPPPGSPRGVVAKVRSAWIGHTRVLNVSPDSGQGAMAVARTHRNSECFASRPDSDLVGVYDSPGLARLLEQQRVLVLRKHASHFVGLLFTSVPREGRAPLAAIGLELGVRAIA